MTKKNDTEPTLDEVWRLLQRLLVAMEDIWIENQRLRNFALEKLGADASGLMLALALEDPELRQQARLNFAEQRKVLEAACRAASLEDMPSTGKPS